MEYTLIHYTEGWGAGPVIELDSTPSVGSLVMATSEIPTSKSDMFYVDNIMHAERNKNQRQSPIYLFVRPYGGYGTNSPMTEADRTNKAIKELREELKRQLEEVRSDMGALVNGVRNDVADVNGSLAELTKAIDTFADNLLEKQSDICELLER